MSDESHEAHASKWRHVLSEVEKVAKLTGNLDKPEVLALIPPNLPRVRAGNRRGRTRGGSGHESG